VTSQKEVEDQIVQQQGQTPSSSSTGPVLPIADQDPAPTPPGGVSYSSHEQAVEPSADGPGVPALTTDLDDTLPYADPDETLPYSDMFCHDTYGAFRVEQLQTAVHTQAHDSEIFRVLAADIETKPISEFHLYAEAMEHSDDTARQMLSELRDEFRTALPAETVGYWYDLHAQSIFRVDDTSGMVTDEDMFKFAHLVEKADFK